jgi:Probable zinc-ribbon domain
MARPPDKYREFVDHPRYGRRPNRTGRNPGPFDRGVRLMREAYTVEEFVAEHRALTGEVIKAKWLEQYLLSSCRVPFTAIVADPARQQGSEKGITHYFDLEMRCKGCKRQFIFFAEEQKYWFEELGFNMLVRCENCCECRQKKRGHARQRARYEALHQLEDRSAEQNLELAELCLALVASGTFTRKKLRHEFARRLLNAIPKDSPLRNQVRFRQALSSANAVRAD